MTVLLGYGRISVLLGGLYAMQVILYEVHFVHFEVSSHWGV